MDVHGNMRQSGGHAVSLPVRSVTLRPCLSAGLPFLLFELFLSTSFIGPDPAVGNRSNEVREVGLRRLECLDADGVFCDLLLRLPAGGRVIG